MTVCGIRPPGYVSVKAAAELLDVSPRSVTRLCRALLAGKAPAGCAIKAIKVHGAGGVAGMRYAISQASLPALPEASGGIQIWSAPGAAAFDVAKAVASQAKQREEIKRKLRILKPALAEPRGTAAFFAVLAAISTARGIRVRTLRGWIEKIDVQGEGSLLRKRPAGRSVAISRVFDDAWRSAGGSQQTLDALAQALSRDIQSMWASEIGDAGAGFVTAFAGLSLCALAKAQGISLPSDVCRVGMKLISRDKAARQVHLRRVDAEGHRNTAPRIARSFATCRPMDIVFLDVRYSPFQIPHEGRYVYPAQIAFLDTATNRMHQTLLPLARGERVSGADVFAAFYTMSTDPEWGLPKLLYHDGGGENMLTANVAAACTSHPHALYKTIKVRPNSPQSKPIEGMFSVFDRSCLMVIRGFPGFKSEPFRKNSIGDRETISYSGSWQQFVAEVQTSASFFNSFKFGKTASRQDRYLANVASGHAPRLGDAILLALGSELDKRQIRHGRLALKGKSYTHDTLYSADPSVPAIIARDPTGQRDPLLIDHGNVVPLVPDPPFPQATKAERGRALSESDRRKKVREDALDELETKLAACVSLRDRVRAANENGLIPGAPSGIVDGSCSNGKRGVAPTMPELLAALKKRRTGERP